ncbi:MAG: hypothetical protein RLZ39_215 [Bacteroidota bacterium]|jgi:heme exporter protein B
MMLVAVTALLKKDLLIEWRKKHTFFGVMLYVAATVFVINLMNGQAEASMWNVLFWITQLFVAINSVAKSFLQESEERFRYYYTITTPQAFMLAKLIYSVGLQLIMSLITLLLFHILLGSPLENNLLFTALAALGGTSLSIVFTFLSAIAAKAQQNASLMAILGFPIVAPILLILSRLALKTMNTVVVNGWWGLFMVLILLNILIIGLSLILFPFLWKE